MIGANIRRLRTERHMTQKALADQLFVSAQAVSRWENSEVEPSVGTITELARILGVSTDELLMGDAAEDVGAAVTEGDGDQTAPEPVHTKIVFKEPPPQVLALCAHCNQPIYDTADVTRPIPGSDTVWCRRCTERQAEEKRAAKLETAHKRRKLSYILGGLAGGVALLICLLCGLTQGMIPLAVCGVPISAALYAYVACLILYNNFVGEMTLTILSWGFVKMPGVIFSLDLEGIVWLLTVKLMLWILGLCIALFFAAVAIAIGGLVSLFVYPYALIKNIHRPEDTED